MRVCVCFGTLWTRYSHPPTSTVLTHSRISHPLPSSLTGVNNTIMADLVPPHLRATIYGLDRMLEGLVAPAGGLAAGWVAENLFGFATSQSCAEEEPDDGSSSGGGDGGSTNTSAADAAGAAAGGGAEALGDALSLTMCIPWAICLLAYTFLHCTYPRDRRMGIRGIVGRRRATASRLRSGANVSVGNPAEPGAAAARSKVERTTLRSDDQAIGSWQEMS